MSYANEAGAHEVTFTDNALGMGEDVTYASLTNLDITPQHRVQVKLEAIEIFGFDSLESTFTDTEGNTVKIGDSPCIIRLEAWGQAVPYDDDGDGDVQDDGVDLRVKTYSGPIRGFTHIKMNL
jgi:hypothetical protein